MKEGSLKRVSAGEGVCVCLIGIKIFLNLARSQIVCGSVAGCQFSAMPRKSTTAEQAPDVAPEADERDEPHESALVAAHQDKAGPTSTKPKKSKAQRKRTGDDDGVPSSDGDRPPPKKRPLNSYMLYTKEMRETKYRDSTLRPPEVAKEIGASWRALSDEERSRYTQMAASLRCAQPSE